MRTKADVARELAAAHSGCEDSVIRIVRLTSEREDQDDEPIKLLEVNVETVPSGVMPVYFGPTDDVPFASVVVELTGSEYDALQADKLELPDNWELGETLFERDAGQ